jgi:hypothetical protein
MALGIRTPTASGRPYRLIHNADGPAITPGAHLASNLDPDSDRDRDRDYPEIDCIRSLLPIGVLMAAQERAARLGSAQSAS